MSTQDPNPSQEWAKFVNRLTDWLLPQVTDEGESKEELPRLPRYLSTSAGVVIWIFGIWVLKQLYFEADIFTEPIYEISLYFLVGIASMFTIVESIKYGTPLRFFLRGLFIPTVVVGIIKLALLGLSNGGSG